MKVVTSIPELQRLANEARLTGKRVGVVPTMGFLHDGHLSLIRIARQHSDVVITTIFVNPAQFAPNEDFEAYPRDLVRDEKLAEKAGTDLLFVPGVREMYPEGYLTYVDVENITKVLEGKSRPTHFRGVTTVVAKLLNIAKPRVAVFGQKDAQQVAVIRQMVKDLNFDVDIIVGPIIRESDGLALSSRNVYLSPEQRSDALVLSQSLRAGEKMILEGERWPDAIRAAMRDHISTKPSASIDYVSLADAATLEELTTVRPGRQILVSLAVRVGQTRLIDNTLVTVP